MEYLRVKNWSEFQHYKDRNPPWIKLHRTLLDDYEFSCLQDASKAHLMLIWLFASQRDGLIPDDPKFLKMKLGLTSEPNLRHFKNHGLLIPEHNDSGVLADCNQNAPLEEDIKLQRTKATDSGLKPDALSVLQFLNEKTGRNYEPVDETLKPIVARLRGGASVEDLRAVVAKKCREWSGDPKMDLYLRPKTLFNATNFANYRGELDAAEPARKVAI